MTAPLDEKGLPKPEDVARWNADAERQALENLRASQGLSAVALPDELEVVAWERRLMNCAQAVNGRKPGEWGPWERCTVDQAMFAERWEGVEGFPPYIKAEARPLVTRSQAADALSQAHEEKEVLRAALSTLIEAEDRFVSEAGVALSDPVSDAVFAARQALSGSKE